MAEQKPDPIKEALFECLPLLYGALLFSFVINLLGLAVPIYSMQVFDRVLSSGSVHTLAMLTLIVAAAVIFTGILTMVRAAGLTQLTRWLDDRLAASVVEKTITLALHRPNIGSQPLRDLGTLRSFASSSTVASILDAPWAIIFFVALFIINMTIGIVTALAAMVLMALGSGPINRLEASLPA